MLGFMKLSVYQKALAFVDHVYRVTGNFPQDETYVLTSQFRRAATSIVLNIAEGAGGDTAADRRRFYTNARGSTFECIAIIDIAGRRGHITEKQAVCLRNECEEITRLLYGLKKSPGKEV